MTSGQLSVSWHGQLAVITMPAEVDMSNGGDVQAFLLATLERNPDVLVVDMAATTFCDSAGLRAVMISHRQAGTQGSEFRLVVGSPGVQRVFSIIGASEHVQIYPDLDSALAFHDHS
ncbi:MAG TPA: STAS domain-containing protein [Streptosporangiaceae bacterium]